MQRWLYQKKLAIPHICANYAHIQVIRAAFTVPENHFIRACRHYMRPIVRFLLRNGVTWDEFNELSKDTFVEMARAEYGIQGRPTNNARVAVLTGLSRREVARVRDRILDATDQLSQRKGNRISQILTAWHTDKEFLDEQGQPKDLPPTGPVGSLASLLKRYAGDLPHGAIRKELLQLGLIDELESGRLKILKRDYLYTALDPEIVRQMSLALHDHASTLEHNLNAERKTPIRFERLADNVHVSSRSAKAFNELVKERGMRFLQEMDAWLSEHEVDTSKSTSSRKIRLGVGVYSIQDEI